MTNQPTHESLTALIKSELRDAGIDEQINGDTRFSDLDFDSIDAAEMMGVIKDEFGIELPRQMLSDATLDQFVERVMSGSLTR